MLDDLKLIHERDKEDALGVAEKQGRQLYHDFSVGKAADAPINNVVLSGMGGSALPGVIVQSWPGLNVPFEIARNYTIPAYVNGSTLFISSSHSGNTEETLEALHKAEEAGAQIVVIASGGRLAAYAQEKNYPLISIPGGIQPRMCAFYFVSALVQLLEPLGLVAQGSTAELKEAGEWLEERVIEFRPDSPSGNNMAKQIAYDVVGKTIIMYGGPLTFAAANKWKISFNENAKNLAWVNQYPEFNHNEFIGWSGQPLDKPFAVVEIRSSFEHPRIQKRFAVTERLLSGRRPMPIAVEPQGDTLIKQLVWAITLGDFASIYLAILNNVDPTPVELVERFKAELDK